MRAIRRWILRRLESVHRREADPHGLGEVNVATLLKAQGDLLALFAALFERHNLISAEELGRSLSDFAALTAEDNPDEGQILSLWASYALSAAATFRDPSSVQ